MKLSNFNFTHDGTENKESEELSEGEEKHVKTGENSKKSPKVFNLPSVWKEFLTQTNSSSHENPHWRGAKHM